MTQLTIRSPEIAALSRRALMPHDIPASKTWNNRTLTEAEIVNNLAALHENVIAQLFRQFPTNLRINSGYRPGRGPSQHDAGQAADIQVINPQGSPSATFPIINWMKDNLQFDQLAMEYSARFPNQCWIHVSYKTSGNRNLIYTWDAAKAGTAQFSTPGRFIVR